MNASLQVELVIPEKLIFSGEAEMAVIPGAEGDMGILFNHAPAITQLRPGVVEIHPGSDEEVTRVFVGGGFAEVTEERCTVLAGEALPCSMITMDMAKERLAFATKAMTNATTEAQRDKAEFALAEAEAMMLEARAQS